MALRVMVVDDALFMRNMLKDIFVRAGFEIVAEGENGEVAAQLYRDTRPDLVTMDIVMPKKSGIEALQEIIADDPQARVVMVSALGQDALVLEAVEADEDEGVSGVRLPVRQPRSTWRSSTGGKQDGGNDQRCTGDAADRCRERVLSSSREDVLSRHG